MPEIIEVELYRRAAEPLEGRRIESVTAPDAWFLKGGLTPSVVRRAPVGRTIVGLRRRGKLLLIDTDGPVLGLRFGMTGRLVVDDRAAISELEYGSPRDLAAWDRFALGFAGGGTLRVNDPRRLGGVVLDPDEDALGSDAFSITLAELRRVLAASTTAIKARLLDQGAVAGLGNLLADETLWRAGIDPARRSDSLGALETRRLHTVMRRVLSTLLASGGSHTGELQSQRHRDGMCPKDGQALERRTIGGRTTFSCPKHQS